VTAAYERFVTYLASWVGSRLWNETGLDHVTGFLKTLDDPDWAALAAGWPSQPEPWLEALIDALSLLGDARSVDLLCAMVLQTEQLAARIYAIVGLRWLDDPKAALIGRDHVVAVVRSIDQGPRELGAFSAEALLAQLR
jgi:hypothetical protein